MAEYPLPGPKDKGWEFTDLTELDLDAYETTGATVEGLVASNGDGPTVLPLAEAIEAHPELVRERLGTIVPAADAFTARNEER